MENSVVVKITTISLFEEYNSTLVIAKENGGGGVLFGKLVVHFTESDKLPALRVPEKKDDSVGGWKKIKKSVKFVAADFN